MTSSPELPAREAGTASTESAGSFVEFIRATLDEKRAADIVHLDVRKVTALADDFLIATITSAPQGRAIIEACEKEAKKRGIKPLGVEGTSDSSWVLMDYGDVIVHLFLPEQRAYYGLEHVWADAKKS